MRIATIGIHLDSAVEAGQDFIGIFALSTGPIMEHYPWRRGAAPSPVVAQHRPEITGLRFAAPGVQHRGCGFVDVEPRAFCHQALGHVINHRGDQRPCPSHPVGQHGPVDRHAVPGYDHRLAVERHVLGMLGHRDLRQQRFSGPAALQKMRRGFCLNHSCAALGAGILRADRDDHLIARRDVVQPINPILTDLNHVATATRARNAVWLDDTFDTRQMLGQCAHLSLLARHLLLGIGLAGRDLRLDRGNLFLGFGDGGFQVLKSKLELRRVQLFRFRPELCVSVLSDLAFQLLDQGLQFGDEGVFFRPNGLFMLARRALDRQIELRGLERLHNLGRKVRKLAEIEGPRRAHS